MQPSSTPGRAPLLAALALVSVAVIAAACSAAPGGESPATPAPTEVPATPAPSAPATPEPTVAPTPEPTVAPSDPADGQTIDLDIADEHDVSVVVKDESGDIADVSSGRAGDGMSVRWFDVVVENIDAQTVRVTWVGLPIDEVIDLAISKSGDGYAFAFDQDAPPANSDAIGFDRVLVVAFDAPVQASDITVSFPR